MDARKALVGVECLDLVGVNDAVHLPHHVVHLQCPDPDGVGVS